MNEPHKCPICEGKGELTKRLAQVGSVVVQKKPLLFRCHGCQGAGLIWDNLFQITIPNSPQIQPWQPSIGPTWISNGGVFSTQDGVAKCDSCNEPIYMQPAKDCKRTSSHSTLYERCDNGES